jgi:hypothetical protein
VQNKSKSYAISTSEMGKLPLPRQQWQRSTKCFAFKTLSHIQQTQCNTRHNMAYSFSGATKL